MYKIVSQRVTVRHEHGQMDRISRGFTADCRRGLIGLWKRGVVLWLATQTGSKESEIRLLQ